MLLANVRDHYNLRNYDGFHLLLFIFIFWSKAHDKLDWRLMLVNVQKGIKTA